MNRIVLGLSLSLLAPFAWAAVAAETPPADNAEQAQKATDEGASVDADSRCDAQTGSRIVRKQREGCLVGAGRTYSKHDIDRTGATNVAEALVLLDPAIR